ncbi:cytochrome P450 [Suillus paluster]|uniref:cytochrome P450 n=1 Tax=Suillus paluster TaxID=48578 RepID=UPI001B886EA7|nr:cytochrome P450 [Suillus paluster]KAG1746004.1 cytochrome P450 [Suillus paluster]
MARINPWLTFTEWGDISHVEVLGQHIIVLNSVKTAMEMLDKKSSVYSDRPVFPTGGELCGWKHSVSSPLRRPLALVPQELAPRCWHSRRPGTCEPTRTLGTYLTVWVIHSNIRLIPNPYKTVGAIILRISHGYEVKENDDPFVDLAYRALDQLSQSVAPSAFMVNSMSSLAKVPEWFPGADFKRTTCEWCETVEEIAAAPYKFVKEQMAAGIAPNSFTSNLLECRTLSAEDHVVKWSALSLYAGGADTTISSVYSLFLAMALFPDAQKKAQAEIDAVGKIGKASNCQRKEALSDEAKPYRSRMVGDTAAQRPLTRGSAIDMGTSVSGA